MSLDVHELRFAYAAQPVLRGVSFRVEPGALSALLGPNGSGKSTLLKHLAGFLPARQGRVRVLGRDLAGLSLRERARLIGFLPQSHVPVFPFRVAEVVLTGRAAGITFLPGRKDREKAAEAMARVGIAHLADRPYSELSGGERQLVLIARVLAQEPRVFLLDEPLAHLDIANQVRVVRLLKELAAAGLTVLIVMHDPNLALLFADGIVVLKEGRVLRFGPHGEMADRRLYEEAYGVALAAVPFGDRFLLVPDAAPPAEPPGLRAFR